MSSLSFFFALIISLGLVPLVRRVSMQRDMVVIPRDDRWHKDPTPTLGGIGIVLAFSITLIASSFLNPSGTEIPWGIIGGALIIFFLGLYDDIKELSPPTKLAGQIVAASLVVAQGYSTNFFTPRIENPIVAQIPNILLTMVWIVGITNAINLLDNIDGLAAGIAFATAIFLGFLFWRAGNYSLLAVSLALAGSVLGFLVYNFPPASIFMGDSGSMFLGFILSVLAIARQPQASNVLAILGVPTLLFLLPILDTALVTTTRILRGESPAQGGRDHTSHRLIAFGFSERQVLLALYSVAIITGIAGLVLEELDYWLSLILVPLLILTFAIITVYLARLKVVVNTKSSQPGTFSKLMIDLTYRRRILEIILDVFLIGISLYLAFLLTSSFRMTDETMRLYLGILPWAIGCAYASFFIFGVYRGVWRYIGVDSLVRFAKATLVSVVLLALIAYFVLGFDHFGVQLYLIYGVFLYMGIAASRASFKILDESRAQPANQPSERVLIVGAGDECEMAIRWMIMNPELQMRAACMLDNDPFLKGRQIHGVDVLGNYDDLEQLIESKNVDGVLLSSKDQLTREEYSKVIAICAEKKIWVKALRFEFESLKNPR
jgi:UDP-GlcNAc:undecaprenyl-phosphate GlcNAc-1-phosphate transferase